MKKNKSNILVVGAGFLGKYLVQKLGKNNYVTTTFCHNQLDEKSIKFDFFSDNPSEVFGENIFDVVIFSAKVEFKKDKNLLKNSMERFINFFGSSYIVYISSDGVFDGKKGRYKEDDTPTPVTLYGNNLLMCESIVKKCQKFCIIRPSYIFSNSPNCLDFRLQEIKNDLERGIQIERFIDMYKSPMDAAETAKNIAKLINLRYQGVIHVAGERMSVYAFFKKELGALGVSTENLIPVRMPQKRPMDFLPDTSLDTNLLKEVIKNTR